MKCVEEVMKNGYPCTNSKCDYYLDYEKDLNCTFACVEKNGALTLRETAERLGISYVRVKQIEEKAMKKIEKFYSINNYMER
jgi:hypothetical protein